MTRRPAFPLPDAILEGDIAILGRKGGGKTVTGKNVVERLLELKHRVVVLDVLGVWAGLRTSADGKKPGYPVAIFGGEFGDLPLDPGGAADLAAVLASENLPAVIDLSELAKSEQNRFVGAFLAELRRVNRQALWLVLEEADVFAPQNPMGDDSKRVHAEIDWISRRGRFRGFRLLTITQRPARLSKDVLTQANTLIVHRLPAPQDREAVKAWVDGNGDRDQAKAVFDTLAGLEVGEAWVYAQDPAMLERVRFPLMRTLDTSSTPKAGESRIQQKTLAQVDVAALRAALTAAGVEVLEKGPRTKITMKAGPDVAALEAAAEARGYDRGVDHGITLARQQLRVLVDSAVGDFGDQLKKRLDAAPVDVSPTARAMLKDLQGPGSDRGRPIAAAAPVEITHPTPAPPARKAVAVAAHASADASLTRPQGELLAGLRWWSTVGHDSVTRHQLAAIVGWKAKGSHLRNRLSELKTRELIDYPSSSLVALTPAGAAIAPPIAGDGDLQTRLRSTLSGPQRQMFDALQGAGGEMSRRALAAELRWEEAGSHLRNRLSELKSMEIVRYPHNGRVALQDWTQGGA